MTDKPYKIHWMNEVRLPIETLLDRYYRPEHLLPLCQSCENYGKNHACPPTAMDMESMVCGFTHIRLFAAKLYLTAPVNKADIEALYVDAMVTFNEKLLLKEADIEGSMAAVPGCCRLCPTCSRIDAQPCRYPNKLRMSLDAFSLEIAQMAKELFRLEIHWYNDKQPDYLTMIGGILETSLITAVDSANRP